MPVFHICEAMKYLLLLSSETIVQWVGPTAFTHMHVSECFRCV